MSELKADAEPGEVGLDAERLGRIDRHFARYVDDGRLPGWLIVVSRRGRIAYVAACGHRDTEAGLPVEADSLWRIYSMSKPITSVAAMILYEEGAFELTDPVSRYLPALADMRVFAGGSDLRPVTVPATEPVRVWHLLTHTSGLTYGFHHAHPVDAIYRARGFEWAAPRGLDLAGCVDAWASMPLLFQPGSEWNYSVATDVLGRLVEVLSGQSLDQFLADRIFGPLGMTDTAFWAAPDRADRLGALYTPGPGGAATRMDTLGQHALTEPAYLSGGGGLVSSDPAPAVPAGQPGGGAGRGPAARPAHRGLHDPQPPARRRRPGGLRPAAVRGVTVPRHRLRARVRGGHRPGRGQDPGLGGRVLLGRRGQHVVLRRPGRAAHRRLLHPAPAVQRLPAALPAPPARLPGDRRLEICNPESYGGEVGCVGPADGQVG
jgi:CubicO group peptidase (beta-lactamase class C family)